MAKNTYRTNAKSDDPHLAEQGPSRPAGLLGAVGALAEFEDFHEVMEEVIRSRAAAADREVDLGSSDKPKP
jgi:hypothetical protein